ncbi:hypothetical protein NTJ56_34395 [Burkholderia contaminans]|uniref:hypothetical protein n=1 Tax=Burkholderia contaminans TaxID=488447 RepID=UPI001CF3BB93|nr:hypothetical protein [Burkholderia contaminans]MCA7917568.1 hypothetical protein [Burkholderia contaminans]MCA8099984.1 hypothetical protein [Burkholderia contaminans]UUX42714.1 hypothetical protein NTJ56_34395 [Burkholderia contaminans]
MIRGIVDFVVHCNGFSFVFCAPRESSGLKKPIRAMRAATSRCAPAENLLEIPGSNFYIIENHARITVLTKQTLHAPQIPNNNT